MSYCRWSSICEDGNKSDLYMFNHVYGGIQLNWLGKEAINCSTRSEAIKNIEENLKLGKRVPTHVLRILKEDLEKLGETEEITYDRLFY